MNIWGYSSAGRAPAWHAGGQGFKSPWLHKIFKWIHSIFSLNISKKEVENFLNLKSKNKIKILKPKSGEKYQHLLLAEKNASENIKLRKNNIQTHQEALIKLKKTKYFKSKKIKKATKKDVNTIANFCIKTLEMKNFFKPIEKKPIMLENLRSIFYKMELSEKETRILSSVFAGLSKKNVHWQNYA